ncbi:MAG TPA: DNA cytosine methyltransferase [Chloroflexota bacterium]|nr:DNA cytosine methyltransferase [Chloroflexota bacterium]
MDEVISVFSGAGGLSLGFTNAGLKPLFGVDSNLDACKSYEKNLEVPSYNLDLNADDQAPLLKLLENHRKPLAVIGGPPCQGFSTAGNRTGRDPRNNLIFNYFALVEYLQPRWFLFENVEGLLTSGGGKGVFELVRRFLSLGYSVRLEKVNFAAFGLPQSRKRVIIIGNRLGLDFCFPRGTHSFESGKHNFISLFPSAPTVMEALAGLPMAAVKKVPVAYTGPIMTPYDACMRQGNQSGLVTRHYNSPNAPDQERLRLLRPGQTMKDLPEELWHPSFRKRAFRRVQDGTPTEKRGGAPSGIKRLRGDLCSLTITSSATREFIHPCLDRPMTPREAARLQSFPDCFEFIGNASSVITQTGNAVPPLAAEVFARHLLEMDGLAGSGSRMHNLKGTEPKFIGYRLTDANGMSPALAHTDRLLRTLFPDPVPQWADTIACR